MLIISAQHKHVHVLLHSCIRVHFSCIEDDDHAAAAAVARFAAAADASSVIVDASEANGAGAAELVQAELGQLGMTAEVEAVTDDALMLPFELSARQLLGRLARPFARITRGHEEETKQFQDIQNRLWNCHLKDTIRHCQVTKAYNTKEQKFLFTPATTPV